MVCGEDVRHVRRHYHPQCECPVDARGGLRGKAFVYSLPIAVNTLSIAIEKLTTRSDPLSIGIEKLMTRSDTLSIGIRSSRPGHICS
jgi:hypothetical protein